MVHQRGGGGVRISLGGIGKVGLRKLSRNVKGDDSSGIGKEKNEESSEGWKGGIAERVAGRMQKGREVTLFRKRAKSWFLQVEKEKVKIFDAVAQGEKRGKVLDRGGETRDRTPPCGRGRGNRGLDPSRAEGSKLP